MHFKVYSLARRVYIGLPEIMRCVRRWCVIS